MALDPRYIPLTTLWQLFSDKDTGNFLRNGYVKFYRDISRTVGKPVYQLTGSPPSYTYIEYGYTDTDGGWRIDLNDQSAFDLIPYAFPFDEEGNVDLYFVQVYSADDVFQFSREGIPNVTTNTPQNVEVVVNYVPNPQFLLHNDLPATDTLDAGEIREATTPIAQGGWYFERPSNSTAKDLVTFERVGSNVSTPEKSPRYVCRVRCQSPAADAFKDLALRFNDVNKFSFSANNFTYAFFAQVNSGSSLNASLVLKKNYGTGGSTPDEVVIGNISIGTSYALIFVSFSFGNNQTKTIGTQNDDYLELAIRFPNALYDVSVVDFNLAEGDIAEPSMPYTTNSQMIYRALAGFFPIPNPDGSDFLLSPILTAEGWVYDDSVVGSVMTQTVPCEPTSNGYPSILGYVYADGSQYETEAYFPGGVPCRRLQSKYMNRSFPNDLDDEIMPRYGTGPDFLTAIFANYTAPPAAGTPTMIIKNNKTGTVTDFSNGTSSPGFTYTNVSSGAVNTNSKGFYTSSNSFWIWGNLKGSPTINIDAGTSGFTVSQARATPETKSLALVTNVLPASGLANKYFRFGDTTTTFYIWFKVNGVGTDPAPGGTGIEVDLLSTWDALTVTRILVDVVTGLKVSSITTVAASAVPAGSYFNLYASTEQYYVWFEKDGSGTDPAPPGKIPIKVSLQSSDDAAHVSTDTLLAINSKYFAAPDLRGLILRGWDNGANIDLFDNGRPCSFNPFIAGDFVGSFEFDDNLAHAHTFQANVETVQSGAGAEIATISGASTEFTTISGDEEARPLNQYVNYLIKY